MKSFIKILGIYFLVLLIYTSIFLGLINFKYLMGGDILLFRGLKLFIFSSIVTIWLILKFKIHWSLNIFTLERIIMATIVSMSINAVCFVLLPVTFDRSVSIYLLNQLKNSGDNWVDINQLIYKMESGFVEQEGAVEKRVKEQTAIGFVDVNGNVIRLTVRGRHFLDFAGNISKLYGLNN